MRLGKARSDHNSGVRHEAKPHANRRNDDFNHDTINTTNMARGKGKSNHHEQGQPLPDTRSVCSLNLFGLLWQQFSGGGGGGAEKICPQPDPKMGQKHTSVFLRSERLFTAKGPATSFDGPVNAAPVSPI